MKKNYLITLLFIVAFLTPTLNVNGYTCYNHTPENTIKFNNSIIIALLPTATITTNTTSVCINGIQPQITFTGSGGTAPYTFVYKIGTGADISIVSTGNFVTVNVPTSTAGSFVYTLVSVADSSGTQAQSESVTVIVNPMPVVDFTFTNNNACSGSTIQFNSNVSGTGPYTYLWDFGDSKTSTIANPAHNFKANNGNVNQSFNVTLTVTDTTTNCVVTIQKNVIVKQLPDLSINSSATLESFNGFPTFKICNNSSSEFVFQNVSTTILTNQSYTIDWGDGSPIFNATTWNTLNHTYAVGLWTITYTITGQNGCATTKIYKAFVGSNPAVSIGNPGNTDVCIATALTFPITGTENNPPGTTYTINFNDGSAPQIFNHPPPSSVTHTFLKTSCGTTSSGGVQTFQNSFSATILASNPCGESAVGVVPIRISTPPIANFTMPTNKACINTPICFTNSSTGASVASTSSCDITPKIVWTITPNTGFTLAAGNLLGSDSSTTNTNLWLTGSNSICPTFTTPGTYTITMKVGNRCGIDQITKTICIEPPLVPQFAISATEGCSPLTVTTTNNTNLNGMCSTPSYLWNVTYTSGYCGSTPSYSLLNGTTLTSYAPEFNFINPGTYHITLRTTNSCGSVTSPIQTVIIKKPPTVTINPITTLCQTGSTTTINPTATIVNCGTQSLTYEWSFPGGSPSTSTAASPGSISYSTSGTFSYSLKVTNECGSTTANSSFTIKPIPTVDDITSQQKCKGQTSDAITFTGTVAGTVFNWSNNNTSIGLAATGSGNINPFTLVNTGTTVLTATITVTPSLNGCLGTPKTFTITVYPEPAVNAVSNLTLCNAATQNGVTFTSTVAGTIFSWTNSNPTIGLATSGTGNTPSFTAINTGTSPIVATITVTPSNALGCNGISKTFTITINPTPSIPVVSNQEYCNGVATTPINFSNAVTGTTYAWTNSNIAIGLAASGTGNIPSFTAKNTGSSPITATISVIPTANGCSGTTQNFTITVNPSPVVTFSIANQVICSGDTSALVTLSSVAGATLNWTAAQPAGIAGVSLSGTDIIPTQTLFNSTNANIVITYNATATLASGVTCAGVVFPYTITVKPKPIIAGNMTAVSCSGSLFTVTPTNGAGNSIPTGTTYSWGTPVVTGGLTGGVSGTNLTSISGTLTNPTNVAQTATYTVTPTFNGCSGLPFDVVITVNPKPDVNTTPNVVLCAGETNSSINFTGNVSGTTYTWTSTSSNIGIATSGTNTIPSFTAINTGTTPVVATITVTPSANGCQGLSKTFTITVNPTPAVNIIPNLVRCNGTASGIITFSGNITGTTFDWTNDNPSIGLAAAGSGNIPSFTTTNSGLSPIIATITVTPKANGCFGIPKSFTITVNPTPTLDLPLNQIVCNGQQTAAINFTGTIPNTTYNWTNNNSAIGIGANGVGDIPAFTATNNGTNPIIATITVTPNLNGCSGASKTFTITINPSPAVIFTPTNQILCSGSSSVLVNLSSTMAGTNFTWTAAQPFGINGVITSGTNTIPVQTLTNSTNLPIVVSYLATAESNSGVSCQGITYPYTITVNPVPSITTLQTQTICSNTAFSIIPTDGGGNSVPAGTTYSWGVPVVTGGITGGAALSNQTTIKGTLINPTDTVQTATYTVTPKSGSCVGSSFTVVIKVNPSPKVVFSGINQTLCSGSATLPITLSSPTTGTVTFNWNATIPVGITGAVASGIDVIPAQTLANTTNTPLTVIYTATATLDANGIVCTGEPMEYKITVNPAIITSSVLSNYSGFNVSAVGASDGNINVTVTGGSGVYTYLWLGPGGFSATSQDISNVPAGVYSLSINDGLCSPITLNFTLTSPMSLLIQEDVAAHLDILCFGYLTGSIKVAITQQSVGPYDYVLTLQGGGTISTIIDSALTNHTFTGLAAGIYDIKVTDANGSVKTILGIVITQPSGITASITAQTNVGCAGSATGSATVTASGGVGILTYSWNTNPIQTSATAIGLTAGTYIVTITDANTCSIQKQAIITEPKALITTIASQTNVFCYGNNTGTATVLASGGTGILSYSWDTVPIQTTATATGLIAGTYHLKVTDAAGCFKVQTVIITQPPAGLTSTISSSTNVTCFGGNDGSATVTVSGGTAPYSYSWNTVPVQTLATAKGLKAGNYSVLISDMNGCTQTTTVVITESSPIKIDNIAVTSNFNGNPISCFGSTNGEITVTASGGSAPLKYSIDNGNSFQNSPIFNGLKAGKYDVVIVDNNGCSVKSNIQLSEPEKIQIIVLNVYNPTCYGSATGRLNIKITGGTPDSAGNYTFKWSNGATSLNQTDLLAGTYSITITDLNNCTQIYSITITQPNELKFTYIKTDVLCSGENSGSIELNPSGGVPNYTYQWFKDGVEFTDDRIATNLGFGIYEAIIKDRNGCYYSEKITIEAPSALTIKSFSYTDALSCTKVNSGTAIVEAEGGFPFINSLGQAYYQYNWSSGETNAQANNLAPGSNWVQVIDQNGCIAQENFQINRPDDLDFKIVTSQTVSCQNKEVLYTIQVLPEGGVPPYSTTFSRGAFNTDPFIITTKVPGAITINVADSRNCVISKVISINFNEIGVPSFEAQSFAFTTYEIYAVNDAITFDNTSTGDALTVLWDFGDGTTSTALQPIHTYTDLGSYTVSLTVTYDYGCSYTYSETIEITQGYNIVVPNGFTPNNDGFNDYFKPVYVGMITARMDVYDTWGSLVYSEEGAILTGWNGMFKNKEAENGNYFYKVIVQPFNSSTPIEINGPFTLIK